MACETFNQVLRKSFSVPLNYLCYYYRIHYAQQKANASISSTFSLNLLATHRAKWYSRSGLVNYVSYKTSLLLCSALLKMSQLTAPIWYIFSLTFSIYAKHYTS